MVDYISLTSGETEERWNIPDGRYERYEGGRLAEQRSFNATDNNWHAVISALDAMDSMPLLPRLRAALAADRAYLEKVAGGTATNADHINQVPVLTRQMIAIMLRTILYAR